jgi:hypothetical protein
MTLGFYLPRHPDMWAILVRNAVKMLNITNQGYLSRSNHKNGIYVSKNPKVVAS